MKKEHPILFSTPMVKAIMEGRKTQTRRVVAKNNSLYGIRWDDIDFSEVYINKPVGLKVCSKSENTLWRVSPKKNVGDILWVRETFHKLIEPDSFGKYLYKANGDTPDKWKPSIFMPKEACRIFLEITNIRVERLQDISEEDAEAEGMEQLPFDECFNRPFQRIWQSINGAGSWSANPFVWVIEFQKINQ